MYKRAAQGGDYIFRGRDGNTTETHLTRAAADKALRKICANLGIDGASTHSWRRSALSNANEAGIWMWFLSWWAGFGLFPGTNCGSLESPHAEWQAQWAEMGGETDLVTALQRLESIYKKTWRKTYEWDVNEQSELNILPKGTDPQLLCGKSLARLGRSTAFDFWQAAKSKNLARLLRMGENLVVVLPQSVEAELLSMEEATLGVRILHASGAQLRNLLQEVGILYGPSEEEHQTLGRACQEKVEQAGKSRRGTALRKCFAALSLEGCVEGAKVAGRIGMAKDGLLFSYKAYHKFFVRAVYVLLNRPDGQEDGWDFLRCTCHPFSVCGQCEHTLVARSMRIPGMRDDPVSSESRPEAPVRGRPAGAITAPRGLRATLSSPAVPTSL